MKIYLGGKIKHGDWRSEVFPGLEAIAEEFKYNPDSLIVNAIFGAHDYVAPFFLDLENPNVSPVGLVNLCRRRIARTDLFFVYFEEGDEESAYGTMIEIGEAKARGKFVAIAAAAKELSREVWFAEASANLVLKDAAPKEALKVAIAEVLRRG